MRTELKSTYFQIAILSPMKNQISPVYVSQITFHLIIASEKKQNCSSWCSTFIKTSRKGIPLSFYPSRIQLETVMILNLGVFLGIKKLGIHQMKKYGLWSLGRGQIEAKE